MKLLTTIIASVISLTTAGPINTPIHANSGDINSQYNAPRGFAPRIQQGHQLLQHQGQQQQKLNQANYRESPEKHARILSYDSQHHYKNYQYSYETENGIKAHEEGQVDKGTQAQGAYSYKGDDGQIYSITYTADEYGFRPQGSHLPTPPPIPEEIAKALEQNAQAGANGDYDDGSYKPQQNQDYQQQYQNSGYQQGYQQNNNNQGYQQNNFQNYQQTRQYSSPQISTAGNSGYQH